MNLKSTIFTLGIWPTFSFLFSLNLSKEIPLQSKVCLGGDVWLFIPLVYFLSATSTWLMVDSLCMLSEWGLRVFQIAYELRHQVTRSQLCLNFSVFFSLIQILNSFESCLIPQLSSSPPDVEAMRIYLILPEFPLLQDSKYYITLTIPLAMAILRLDTNPSKVLGEFNKLNTSGLNTFYFIRVTTGSQWTEI